MTWWDTAYEGVPPWDIGAPQAEYARLAKTGEIKGSVLDVGCGTGENALFVAGMGHEAWGVDISHVAIEKARAKAESRRLKVTFVVGDALNLSSLGRSFDTVIDSGLFHTLDDDERPAYRRSLASVLRPGGTYFMLCMSDKEPADWGGPRRIRKEEIEETFGKGWRINYVREARFGVNLGGRRAPRAWLSSITKA